MNLAIVAMCMVVGCQNPIPHGGHMAVFKYRIESTSVVLEFQIERGVLDHFELEKECEAHDQTTALCLFNYIDRNTSLHIQDEKVRFELEGSLEDEDLSKVKMVAIGNFQQGARMVVNNRCFLEFDPSFKNRVVIQRQDAIRSYLLGEENTELVVSE